MQRPKQNSNEARELAVDELWPDVKRWLEECGDPEITEEEASRVKQCIIKNLCYDTDGYKLTKALEDDLYIDADAALVEVMENATFAIHHAHKTLVKKWVKEQNIKPLYQRGDMVRFTYTYMNEPTVGEIVRVDESDAIYTIYVQSLGHVRSGPGTHGVCIEFEKVLEKVNEVG